MSMFINTSKVTYASTGVQKQTVDGKTTYTAGRAVTGPNGNTAGTELVLIDSNSDGKIDSGQRAKGAVNAEGEYAWNLTTVNQNGVQVQGQVDSQKTQAVWNTYVPRK